MTIISIPCGHFIENNFFLYSRMEETVRSMLVYKKQAEQLRQEKNALTLAFEVSFYP